MMPAKLHDRFVVAALAGLDPTGGAGIVADVLAVNAAGAQIAPLLTANTIQGPGIVTDFLVTDPVFFKKQLHHLIESMKPDSYKLGMAGSSKILTVIKQVFSTCAVTAPLVVDPVKSASSGGELVESGVRHALLELGSFITLLTPNRMELGWLAGQEVTSEADIRSAVDTLGEQGIANILIKGGHFQGDPVDILWVNGNEKCRWTGVRYQRIRRGTGCSLASYAAAELAKGNDVIQATGEAYRYVQNLIKAENDLI